MQRSTVLFLASFLGTSMVTSAASIRAASQNVPRSSSATEEERQLQFGGGGGSFFPSLPPIAGGDGGDGFGNFGGLDGGEMMQDQDGNGIPDWIDTSMPDWGNMDWGNFSIGDLDWGSMNWNTGAWGQFLQGLLGGQNSSVPMEFCPILESAVGLGQSFGIAGNCTCDGNLGKGLMIDCDFQDCMEGSTNCTDIGLNFTFNDTTGIVNTSVCVDAPGNIYQELCFSYQLDMPATGDAAIPEQSCQASYAGKACGCTIEGLCVALDCSSYLPGAKMDTCQYLSFIDAGDATSLIPNFPMFNETFNGSFSFGSVNWTNLDWANVDWNNFGFDRVNWTGVNGTSMSWGSLFNAVMNQTDICSILTGRVLSMDADMANQDCTCTGGLESGFSVKCSFEEECAATTATGGSAISQVEKATTQENTICGDVSLDFEFNNLDSVNGSVCVDYSDDVHPTTCFNYSIPIADQQSQPQCEATYGDKPCKCSIDQSLCVKVDCSAYEASAVMDTCQVLSLEQQGNVSTFIPQFGLPSQATTNTFEATTSSPAGVEATTETGGAVASEANELQADNSASTSRIVSLALAAASILSIITL